MKISKDELKKEITELVSDNEVAIKLLEDVEDSMDIVVEVDTAAYDELQAKLVEVQAKLEKLQEDYKNRFLNGTEEETSNTGELTEEEVIDIKEI